VALGEFPSTIMRGSVAIREYGLGAGDAATRVAGDWTQAFGLDETQVASATALAAQYVQQADAVVRRYGASDEDLAALSPSDRRRLDADLLDVQREYERRLAAQLHEPQRAGLADRPIVVLRFSPGRTTASQEANGLL
jgi:hypothetical protein